MQPKISIISGIYFPPEDLFRKFLDSCLNTTLEGVEFILLLDSPNDTKSKEILEEYKERILSDKNKFTIFLHKKNCGIADTYIEGIQYSKGKYIMFFDSDDFFDAEYLEKMFLYAEIYNANILKGQAITHYYNNIDINYMFTSIQQNYVNHDDWLFMYNRDFFVFGFDYKTNRYDTETMKVKCEQDYKKQNIAFELPLFEGVFYHYMRHDTNTSNIVFDRQEINYSNNDYIMVQENLIPALQQSLKNKKIDTQDKNKTADQMRKIVRCDKQQNVMLNYNTIKGL